MTRQTKTRKSTWFGHGLLTLGTTAVLASVDSGVRADRVIVAQDRAVAAQVVVQGGGGNVVFVADPAGPVIVPGNGGFTGMRSDGFQVASGGVGVEDTAAAQAMLHFREQDWFKAITAIESLGESGDNQMITDPTGVLRPVSSLRQSLLDAMPDEGKQTFRRLNRQAASTKLDEALQLESIAERASALEDVISRYALCNAAAQAASILGDLRYEAGRFDEAAGLYRRAAEHPGSTPDDPGLMVKRLHALARAGHWPAFDVLAEYAAFRHPDTTVTLGGESVGLAQAARALSLDRSQRPSTNRGNDRRLLPIDPYPAYSIKLTDKSTDRFLQNAAMQNRFGGNIGNLLHPQVAAGAGRFYTLYLDQVTAYQAETGSELWQDGNARANARRFTNSFYYLQMDYQQHLSLHDQLLLVTNSDPESANWSRLRAIDVTTGEVSWNTRSIGAVSNFSFVGRPLVVGDQVLSVARENTGAQLKLVALSRVNGALAWQMELGTATNDPQWNQPVDINPRLVLGDRYLMVLTNNGGVVAVDLNTKAIAWAFAYPILPTRRVRRGGYDLDPSGDLVAHGGVVYFKDTRDNNLHAIREHDATRLWSVPVARDETIVSSNDRYIYLLGDELVAYEMATGKKHWWSPHAGRDAGRPVFADHNALVYGSQRSTLVDLSDGKVTDFRNDLSGSTAHGALVESGQMLGFVGRDWVRVYRMPLNPSATDRVQTP